MYAEDTRPRMRDNWRTVSRISPEEVTLAPWFASQGWMAQCPVKTGGKPAQFALDFGLPERLLYIEIDGTSHRIAGRPERDARRDSILSGLGWSGLRIQASDVHTDIEAVKRNIAEWASNHAAQLTHPLKK